MKKKVYWLFDIRQILSQHSNFVGATDATQSVVAFFWFILKDSFLISIKKQISKKRLVWYEASSSLFKRFSENWIIGYKVFLFTWRPKIIQIGAQPKIIQIGSIFGSWPFIIFVSDFWNSKIDLGCAFDFLGKRLLSFTYWFVTGFEDEKCLILSNKKIMK